MIYQKEKEKNYNSNHQIYRKLYNQYFEKVDKQFINSNRLPKECKFSPNLILTEKFNESQRGKITKNEIIKPIVNYKLEDFNNPLSKHLEEENLIPHTSCCINHKENSKAMKSLPDLKKKIQKINDEEFISMLKEKKLKNIIESLIKEIQDNNEINTKEELINFLYSKLKETEFDLSFSKSMKSFIQNLSSSDSGNKDSSIKNEDPPNQLNLNSVIHSTSYFSNMKSYPGTIVRKRQKNIENELIQ